MVWRNSNPDVPRIQSSEKLIVFAFPAFDILLLHLTNKKAVPADLSMQQ
jgi:hypothetical protein